MATEIAVKNAVTHPGVSELNKIAIIVLVLSHFWCYCRQRKTAWRCGGFLALKFNRITAVEPCTNVHKSSFSRHIAKPMLCAALLFIRVLVRSNQNNFPLFCQVFRQ